MGLRTLHFKEDYRSGRDDILHDFMRPALSRSRKYWRAVGYFSSSSLEALGTPLAEFIQNGGTMRLVTSVQLSDDDVEAIQRGANQKTVCERRLLQIVQEEFLDGVGSGVARLALLLELGRLEVRIAVPKTGTGVYHEKIGLFIDGNDFVAFSGSVNESRTAFEYNRESIDVFTSWRDSSRANGKRTHFEEVWSRQDQGINVYSFPEAVKKELIRRSKYTLGHRTTLESVDNTEDKWRHQNEALSLFLERERGILNMATGTGKTRSTLKITSELVEKDLVDTVIIATDGNDLLDQWYREILNAWERPDQLSTIYRHYDKHKEIQEFLLEPTGILLVSRAAVRGKHPMAEALRSLGREQARRTLLIHDEVHRLGSLYHRENLEGLSDHIRFRLGLSATPEREYDEIGNAFIDAHIGSEIFRFELQDAIRRGILSPFDYYPLFYQLSDEDRQRIRDVFRKQAARASAGEPMSEEELWIEIARVYKTSEEKLPVFREFIKDRPDLLRRCIIFVETEEYGDKVLDLVHEFRADFHTYYSGESSSTLDRFASGDLECLITCHRISEGIDIRSLNTVILFSSARARLETIQRIGRCLRFDPTNPRKVANVIDFLRRPDDESVDSEELRHEDSDMQRYDWLKALSQIRPEGWSEVGT